MYLNALTRTMEHLISQMTTVLVGTMIFPKTAVNMMMMILRLTRCAAHVKLLVYISKDADYH